MRFFLVLPLLAVASAGLSAQTADQPLTNSEIESMLAGGVPESAILNTIGSFAYRGLVDFDASPSALIALKRKGATERVLNAVIRAAPIGAGVKQEQKQEQEEERAVPGLPGAAGVYYKKGSQWITPPSFLLWPPFYSGINFYSRKPHEYSVGLGASRANLQIGERQPAFYLRDPDSDGWQIFSLALHRGQRFLRLVSGGGFAGKEGIARSTARQVQIAPVAGDVFTLRPAEPLQPGEYVLCSVVPGSDNLNVCYGFGIQ